MPTSIPYDPSLELMSIVSETALRNVEEISKSQAPVDAAQDALNSLISSKRALMLTKAELNGLGVGTDALDAELASMNTAIEKAAGEYATAKMAAEPQIQALRKNIRAVRSSVESPVDYSHSHIATKSLAADSVNTDVQYFSFDSDQQNPEAYSAQIASFVSGSVSGIFGPSSATKVGVSAARQIATQVSSHSIKGTLVLTVSCTHKNAIVVEPFVMQVDKAIKVWNHLFPNHKLDPTSSGSMLKCAMNEIQEDKHKFSIISGTTFGSSFVGMVHVLQTADASTSETMQGVAASIQKNMDTGAWYSKSEDKMGVNAKFSSDVKKLLNRQNVEHHATILCTGVIPSMVADEVKGAADKFKDFNPVQNMAAVAALQNEIDSAEPSVQSMAKSLRTAGQPAAMQGEALKSTISAVEEVEDTKNKILDVNSMMTALDDYLEKAAKGNSGHPINYLLKDVDQKMLAQMWLAKYYPGKYMTIKYDDSEGHDPDTNKKGETVS